MDSNKNNPSPKVFFRAILETGFISLVLLILIALAQPEIPEYLFIQSFFMVSIISATFFVFRLPAIKGNFSTVFFREGFRGFILSLVIFSLSWLVLFIFRDPNYFGEEHTTQFFSMFVLLCSSVGFYVLRGFLWLLKKWDHLRRTHFQWNLTHNFVSIILAALVLFFLINLSFVLFNIYPYNADTEVPQSFFAKIIHNLSQVILPQLLIFLFIAFISILFAAPPLILFSYLITRKFTKRLINLTQATQYLKEGDLTSRTPIQGEDEVAQLQTAFNQMAENLEVTTRALKIERDKVTDLLNSQKEFIATISHELRTPVATMTAYLENNLSHVQSLPQQTQKDLVILQHEAEQLNSLINDLFSVAQIETNQLSLQFTSTQIDLEIQSWLAPLKQLAWKNQRVEISTEFSNNLPSLMIDPVRLEQIILNLVHNALRHTSPGGLIQIRAEQKEKQIRIHVVDTGEGIPKDELPFIWDKYFRGKSGQHRGNGIGLALVKDLVTAMHGEIWVDSTINEGSHFWIDFPLA